MKILAIRGKNLASLAGEFSIDFTREPLASAGIFAITGSTGAGKSTILDAICLALYAKTPRLVNATEKGIVLHDNGKDEVQQNDVRNILRKSTAEGYAEVEFKGIDNQTYRARWSVWRAAKKITGSMQQATIELWNVASGNRLGDKKENTLIEIERLVGLTFEQFTRSVLLAQGEFTAFLKAERKEKTSLLEKLTGTDIYRRISQQIYEKTKQAKADYELLERQLQNVQLLDAQQRETLQTKQAEQDQQVNMLTAQKKHLADQMAWLQQNEKLQADIQQAAVLLEKSEKLVHESQSRKEQLARIESVQAPRPITDNIQRCQKNDQEKRLQLQTLQQTAQQTLQALQNAENNVQKCHEQYETATKLYNEARPKIDAAKTLDVQIQHKANEVKSIENETTNATDKQTLLQQSADDKNKALQTLEQKINTLDKWLSDNERLQVLSDNITIITSQLQQAAEWQQKEAQATQQIAQTNEQITTFNQQISQYTALVTTKQSEYAVLQKNVADLEQQKQLFDIANMATRREHLQQQADALMQARNTWIQLFEKQNTILSLTDELTQTNSHLQQQRLVLSQLQTDLQQASIRKEQTEKLLHNARLATTTNVVHLRGELQPHQPCPVCGSTEHPYKSQTTDINDNSILQQLQHEAHSCEADYVRVQKEIGAAEQSIQSLTLNAQKQQSQIEKQQQQLQTLQLQWQNTNIAEQLQNVANPDRLALLDQQTETLKQSLQTIIQQEKEYRKTEQLHDAERKKAQQLQSETEQLQQNLAAVQQQSALLQRDLLQYNAQIQECTVKTDAIVQSVDHFFEKKTWLDEWKKKPDTFLKTLIKSSNDWADKQKQRAEAQQQRALVYTETEGLLAQLKEAQNMLQTWRDKNNQMQLEYNVLQQQRQQYFEGKNIAMVEKSFEQQQHDARQTVEKVRQQLQQLAQQQAAQQAALSLLEADIQRNTTEWQQAEKQLQTWLHTHNQAHAVSLTYNDLLSLLQHDTVWIQAQRADIAAVNDNYTQAQTSYQERKRSLDIHLQMMQVTFTADQLQQQIQQTEQQYKTANNTLNECIRVLRNDDENRQKSEVFVKQLTEKHDLYNRWRKLDELLGSSDGQKFTQIAQEYTLDILLGYANVHLSMLSERYELQRIPNSLGLQVIDKDMGNEIRSVHSLSGGESFLTSLALALGLSSLSSNRMKVESLFIDEGFGTLDADTLRVTMDALERLQSQGRKVGVISHVSDMTERINARINVRRVSAGKSSIFIEGQTNQLF